jgi:hypothetical protein
VSAGPSPATAGVTPDVTTRARRTGLFVVLLLTAALAAFAGRELMLGADAVRACDEALGRGDLPGAIDAAREAAEARVPGSPYAERGFERLEAIARTAEARDDDATATSAWRSVRAAALATTTLGGASAHLERANLALTRAPHLRTTPQMPDPAAYHDAVLAALTRDDTPPASAFALLGAGAVAFFGGLLQMLMLPVGATRRQLAVRASVAAVGLGLALIACLRN